MIAVICSKKLARTVPINYILLLTFTLAISYLVGNITTHYRPELVLKAAFITLIVTIALTAYALTTSHDLTVCGGAGWIFASVFLSFLLFTLFLAGPISNSLYASVWAVIYGFYLIHDT